MVETSQSLYQHGALALKQAHYAEAISTLERFCKETVNRQSKQFFQAQMWLIQAYHKEHQDLHAIALCEQLAKSEIPQVKTWADDAMTKLMDTTEPSAMSAPPSADAISPFSPDSQPPAPDSQPAIASATQRASAQVSPDHPLRSTQPAQGGNRSRSRSSSKSGQKDYTNQVLTAVAHGSISMLASILLYALFADSLLANGLGILRFAVPLAILLTTDDAVVKANAREAVNYVITCLILMCAIVFASIFLVVVFVVAWPLAILMGIALVVYLIALSIYPIVATILCATDENRIFHYPKWLILHLI
jgi:uncharacterized Tic20 family protein